MLLREVKHWLEHSETLPGETVRDVLEYFREHHYQLSLLWKAERMYCTAVRLVQA